MILCRNPPGVAIPMTPSLQPSPDLLRMTDSQLVSPRASLPRSAGCCRFSCYTFTTTLLERSSWSAAVQKRRVSYRRPPRTCAHTPHTCARTPSAPSVQHAIGRDCRGLTPCGAGHVARGVHWQGANLDTESLAVARGSPSPPRGVNSDMTLSIGQKCVRVLHLLSGLGIPAVSERLVDHGFEDADLERGWELLRATTGTRLDVTPFRSPDPTLFQRLDAWENYWFPIVHATLSHHYPEVAAELFLNLTQTEGLEVAVSVGTLLGRMRTAQNGNERQQAAIALLAKRGLTEEVIGDAEQMLKRLESRQQRPNAPPPDPAERAAAEAAMWAWYLEWSTIVRQAITDRRLLRVMGFLRPGARTVAAAGIEPDDLGSAGDLVGAGDLVSANGLGSAYDFGGAGALGDTDETDTRGVGPRTSTLQAPTSTTVA